MSKDKFMENNNQAITETTLRNYCIGMDDNGNVSLPALNDNFLIEAGAGAGKTYTIVHRVIAQLKNGLDPSEIALITFTNKAAEELRNRIYKSVREEAEKESDPDIKNRLVNAKNQIDQMQISTIHSFCLKLLRECPVEAGIPYSLINIKEEDFAEDYFHQWLLSLDKTQLMKLKKLKKIKGLRIESNQFYSVHSKSIEDIFKTIANLSSDIKIHDPEDLDDPYPIFHEAVDSLLKLSSQVLENKPTSVKELTNMPLKNFDIDLKNKLVTTDEKEYEAVIMNSFFRNNDTEFRKDIKLNCSYPNAEKARESFQIFWKDKQDKYPDEYQKALKSKKSLSANPQLVEDAFEDFLNEFFCMAEKAWFDGDLKKDRSWNTIDDLLSVDQDFIDAFLTKKITQGLRDAYTANTPESHAAFLNQWNNSKSVFKTIKLSKKDKDLLNSRIKEIVEKTQEAVVVWKNLQQCSIEDEKNIYDLLMDVVRYYKEHRKLDEVDNDLLLILTREMLQNYPEVREYFASKYRSIYVDEFQDTDIIQEEIILMLTGNKSRVDKIDQLRDGSLFIVGDPKQSIYRFRNADPKRFISLKKFFENSEKTKSVEFKKNFRSNDLIVDWVNLKFGNNNRILVNNNYQFLPMESVYPLDNGLKNSAKHYGIPIAPQGTVSYLAGVYKFNDLEPQNPNDDSRTIEDEPEQLLKLIQKLANNPDYLIRDMQNKTVWRPIRYSDFLILFAEKNRSNMNKYQKIFEENGIPVNSSGKILFYSELNLYVKIYAYLANPNSETKLAALESLNYAYDVDSNDRNSENRDLLDELYKMTKGKSSYGLAVFLLKRILIILQKNKPVSSEYSHQTENQIRQMIENVCIKNMVNPAETADKFQNWIDSREQEYQLSLEENTDSLRMMNIHKAKGLESNIVIIAERLSRKDNEIQSAFNENKDGTMEYYYRLPLFPKIEQAEKLEQVNERLRLEYVAATRAAEILIICQEGNECKEKTIINQCLFHDPSYNLDSLNDTYKLVENTNVDVLKDYKPLEEDEIKNIIAETDEIHDAQDSFYKSITPSSLEKNVQIKRDSKNGTANERITGNIFGNMLHRALELLMNRSEPGETIPNNLIDYSSRQALIEEKRAAETWDDSKEEKELKQLNIFLESFSKWIEKQPFWKKGTSLLTEVSFSQMYSDTDEDMKLLLDKDNCSIENFWIHGFADLVIKDKSGKVYLYDYKSDDDYGLNENDFVESVKKKYTNQLECYRHILSKWFSIPKKNIRTSLITFSYFDESSAELKETVRIREIVI